MLSAEQLIITAYIGDGVILCRSCGEAEGLPMKDAMCDYAMQSDFEEGAWCEDCGKEIVEPYEEELEEEDDLD